MDKDELLSLIILLRKFRDNASESDATKDFIIPSYEIQSLEDTIAVLDEQYRVLQDI